MKAAWRTQCTKRTISAVVPSRSSSRTSAPGRRNRSTTGASLVSRKPALYDSPCTTKVALRCAQECGFDPRMILPHGSYLLNAGSSDEESLKKTREMLLDEAKRCDKLGIAMYNFHPGFLLLFSALSNFVSQDPPVERSSRRRVLGASPRVSISCWIRRRT